MISPLVPKDADLRSYTWLKLDYSRLFASEFFAMANDAEFRAAFILWCKSMQQLPAGSLPNNDKVLAGWTGKNKNQWAKIKEVALHGWQLADDGRLYHPVLAEVVNDILNKADGKSKTSEHDEESKKGMTNAERQAAYRARVKAEEEASRNAQANNQVTDSNVTSNGQVTERNVTSNATVTVSNGANNDNVTDSNGDFVTNEGVGGDLDLKQELNLESLKASEDKSSGSLPPTTKPDESSPDSQVPPDSFTTTARQTLWTVGIPLLTQYGSNDKAARSFLGQMVKIYGEDMVAESVISARTTKPMDATAYIGGFLKNKAKQNINQGTQARKQTSHVPDNNSTSWMTPELEAQLNAKFAA